jgi:hypothetical protein
MGVWIVAGPTSGNKTLAFTGTVSSNYLLVAAASYTGVDSAGEPDSHADSGAVASPATGTTTVVLSSCWLVMGVSGESGTTTAGSATTFRAGDGFGGNIAAIMDSNATVGTGAQSLNATSAGNIAWNILSLAPKSAGGGGSSTGTLTLLGAGS